MGGSHGQPHTCVKCHGTILGMAAQSRNAILGELKPRGRDIMLTMWNLTTELSAMVQGMHTDNDNTFGLTSGAYAEGGTHSHQ